MVLGFIHKRIYQAYTGRVIIYTNIKSQVEAISYKLRYKLYYSIIIDYTRVI